MNSLHIIGNLTAEPELRTTSSGQEVCSFTVAVNRKKTQNNQNPGADFFRISAWNERGKVCNQYLHKGSKVSVVGPVSCRSYTKNDGTAAASLEVRADDVEFLSSKGDQSSQASRQTEPPKQVDEQSGYEQVALEEDELPF